MNTAYEIKADLIIAIQTLNIVSFKQTIENSPVPLTNICDHNNSNLFHDIATSGVSEDVDFQFLEILISSFYTNYKEKASELIKSTINKATTSENLTPLMQATYYNKIVKSIQKLIKEFVRLGASCDTKNKNFQSPMHVACAKGFIQLVVYYKYEQELSFDELDTHGMTPGHLAIKEGKEPVVLLLIAWGLYLETIDSRKNTLLHCAALANNYRISRVLIIQGADRNAKNEEGLSPYQIAEAMGKSPSLISILVSCK